MFRNCAVQAISLVLLSVNAVAGPIPVGSGEQKADLSTPLTVFTYRPANCQPSAILLVLHGLNRNASRYRDYARPLADSGCMLAVAPLFDKDRFPTWRYQQGGIVRRDKVQKPSSWTGNLVVEVAEWARKQEQRDLDEFIIGHSAGAQFLSRIAAFTATGARRLVIANPSTHVFPTLDVDAPFGMKGVYPRASAQSELRRYLGLPVTIFLGETTAMKI